MKTQLISIFSSGKRYGIVSTTTRLANAFASLGYHVHVIPGEKKFSRIDELRTGVGIHYLPTFHLVTGVLPLARYMLLHKPDVILTGVYQHAILALRTRSLIHSPCRIYAAVRNPYSREWEHVTKTRRQKRISRIRKYYPATDGIIANSDAVALDFNTLTGIRRSDITTIYNPSFDNNIRTLMMEPVHHRWFDKAQPPVILSVGRLEKQKNLYMLIDAFEMVRQTMQCRLVIIGEGTLDSVLRSRANESPYSKDIEFLGHRDNPFPYMHLASVFVLSSIWEGFGNVLVESLATGTPVVSTDCPGGPREIIGKEKFNRLVPVGDARAMADAITEVLNNPPDRHNVMAAAERFSATLVAQDYLKLFGLVDHIQS